MRALFLAANTVMVLRTSVPATTRLTVLSCSCKRTAMISVHGSLRLVFSIFSEGVSTAVAEFWQL